MAAEIDRRLYPREPGLRASMRPRRMAAEIVAGHVGRPAGERASMRPRRMAAEIAIDRNQGRRVAVLQ